MKCKECFGECPEGAVLCLHCGEAANGKECGQCRSRVKTEASICKWCGHKFSHIKESHWQGKITASTLPSLLFRFRLIPQEVEVSEDNLILRSPGVLRLWANEDEIPWNKVAGFNYRDGIFWDTLTVETRGQKASTIIGLSKNDGRRIRNILQGLER